MSESIQRTIPSKPHFFKLLLPGFEHELSIPVSFFNYLKGQECERAFLRSRGGKLWPIKINGGRFENGWEQFAKDHDLHVGDDFVVFRHEGDMVFDVIVLDPSTCEREYPPFSIKDENIKIQDALATDSTTAGKSKKKKHPITRLEGKASTSVIEHRCSVIKLTASAMTYKLHIPMKFARENGLNNGCCEVVIRDQGGSSWPGKLWCRKNTGEVFVGRGWATFRAAHDLQPGDSLIVEVIKKRKRPILKIRRLQENPEVKREHTNHNAQAGSSSHGQSHLHAATEAIFPKNCQQPPSPSAHIILSLPLFLEAPDTSHRSRENSSPETCVCDYMRHCQHSAGPPRSST